MPRLIDADALICEALTEACFDSRTEDVFLDLIDAQPTVDVEPVRHGMWKPLGQICRDYLVNNYRCSECDQRVHFRTNYCPNCGAKMDGNT